eukprot:6328902-Heterocapsa_arctica.AAC.1
MECGTLKGQPKDEIMEMGYACCVNVGKRADFNTFGGNEIKQGMNSEPQCLWTTGVITKGYTALPDTEYMKGEDISLPCTGKAEQVY